MSDTELKPLKIVHVVRQFSPAVGGLESFVKSLALTQISLGMDVKVVTLNRIFHKPSTEPKLPAIELVEGIPVSRVSYFGSYKYPIALGALSKIKNADIIHVHGIDFFADFFAFMSLFKRRNLVISTHGGFFHTPYASFFKHLFFNVVTRFTLSAYQAVFACSESDYKQFKAISSKNLYLIENGVDTEKFSGQSQAKQASKQLLFIGRFSDNKQLDLLINTFAELVCLDKQYSLVIIGKDWDNNLAKLTQLIEAKGLTESVKIITDLPDFQISAYVESSGFIISASAYEGFGLSIIEGMAGGLIPICSNISSFEKIIQTAGVGLIAHFNQADVSVQIHHFIQSQLSNYEAQSNAARQAAKQYSWSVKVKEFSTYYEKIIGTNSRNIHGVEIDTQSANQVIVYLDQVISQNQKAKLAFANAHTINLAQKDNAFKKMLSSFLILNDGIGVELASRYKYGKGFVENLNGTDFIPKYLAESKNKLKIYLLGASAEVVSDAFSIWATRFPQHHWCGFHHGYLDNLNSQTIIENINQSGANLLIVAMGNPKQEKWIYAHEAQLKTNLAVGVGALFDFTAGRVTRAPKWLQQIKMEWVYRLLQEPSRMWRRYLLGNLRFIFRTFKRI